MKSILKTYLERCQLIFHKYNQNYTSEAICPDSITLKTNHRKYFENSVKLAENTKEFEAFVTSLQVGTLCADIERLAEERKRIREREKKNGNVKFQDLDKWKRNIARQAAKGFFRNTAVYINLWQGLDVGEASLISILNNYRDSKESDFIRLFVFDGFVLYDDKKLINNVSLPIGELKKYTQKELEDVLKVPQSFWHSNVNPEVIRKATPYHILTIKDKEEYRGITGVCFYDDESCYIDWANISEQKKKESDINIIGPFFLCIGEDANLAVEIRVRTNIFDYLPVHEIVRNDFLPWDSYSNEGEPRPRTNVHHIGESGNKLRKVCEIWDKINNLDKDGHLKYPTEAYVRSVMNLHVLWESFMETFVGFVTVIESLLTPGTRQDLTYKMAIRGASIMASDPKNRIEIFRILDDFYKIRSQIVHEGRTEKEDPHELNNIITNNLSEISRHILLRYICLLYLAVNGDLPTWVQADAQKLSSRNNRPQTIAHILDSLVLDPSLTKLLEDNMKEWGVFEDCKIRIGFRKNQ